jgi:AcrR family transcriptional regulator
MREKKSPPPASPAPAAAAPAPAPAPAPVDASTHSTPERILLAAERLFAENGIDAVSLREVTVEAGVNIAAVHYHFGSKKAVLEELFALRARPIAERRLELLAQVKRDRQGKPVLEEVLRAFLRPALDVPSGPNGGAFVLLRARLAFERADVRRAVLGKAFDASNRKFLEALAQALPALTPDRLYWRFHFLLGAMVYTMASPGRIESMTGDAIDTTDSEHALAELVQFAAAGLKAG